MALWRRTFGGRGLPQNVPELVELFPSIGKHLPIFLGPGTVLWHDFSGKNLSVFRGYAVPAASILGTMGSTMPDTKFVKGFVNGVLDV